MTAEDHIDRPMMPGCRQGNPGKHQPAEHRRMLLNTGRQGEPRGISQSRHDQNLGATFCQSLEQVLIVAGDAALGSVAIPDQGEDPRAHAKACPMRKAQARDATEKVTSSAVPVVSRIQRPTGVTKPVLARPRLAAGNGGTGMSAT